jgi:hypothetical protein
MPSIVLRYCLNAQQVSRYVSPTRKMRHKTIWLFPPRLPDRGTWQRLSPLQNATSIPKQRPRAICRKGQPVDEDP